MVQIKSFFLCFLTVASLAAATPFSKLDVVTVENDITQRIGPQVITLGNDVNGFPNSGLNGSVAIDSDFRTLIATLGTATTNIKNTGSFGTASGTTILTNLQQTVPVILSTLNAIGSQSSAWSAIPDGTALMLSNLQSLNYAFSKYIDALIFGEPFPLRAGGVAIKTQISSGFSTAIAAYSY